MAGKQLVGSGKIVSMSFDQTNFDSIDVESIYHVDVSLGDEFRISVEADDNVMERLAISESSGVLRLGTTRGSHNFRDVTLHASIQLPALRSLRTSGASSVKLTEITSSNLQINASGASKVTGQVVCHGDLEAETSGASRVSIVGTSIQLRGQCIGGVQVESRRV